MPCADCALLEKDSEDVIGGYHCRAEGVPTRIYSDELNWKHCCYFVHKGTPIKRSWLKRVLAWLLLPISYWLTRNSYRWNKKLQKLLGERYDPDLID